MRRRLLKCLAFVAIVVVGFNVFQYVLDAKARANANECYAVTSPSGLYRSESCVTGMDGNLVFFVGKLYDAHSGKVLARTDFDSMDGGEPAFMPDESATMFRGSEETGEISIPPNWLERLKAKIP